MIVVPYVSVGPVQFGWTTDQTAAALADLLGPPTSVSQIGVHYAMWAFFFVGGAFSHAMYTALPNSDTPHEPVLDEVPLYGPFRTVASTLQAKGYVLVGGALPGSFGNTYVLEAGLEFFRHDDEYEPDETGALTIMSREMEEEKRSEGYISDAVLGTVVLPYVSVGPVQLGWDPGTALDVLLPIFGPPIEEVQINDRRSSVRYDNGWAIMIADGVVAAVHLGDASTDPVLGIPVLTGVHLFEAYSKVEAALWAKGHTLVRGKRAGCTYVVGAGIEFYRDDERKPDEIDTVAIFTREVEQELIRQGFIPTAKEIT